MKTQISTSVSLRTRQQADDLLKKGGFATLTEILAVAIDRLYQKEMPSDAELLRAGQAVACASCDRPIEPDRSWHPGPYGDAYHDRCPGPSGE